MVVPAQLTRMGGGGLSPVDFACGATSGRVGNSIFDTRFSPAGGLSDFGPVGGAGEFNVDLGWAPPIASFPDVLAPLATDPRSGYVNEYVCA